MLIRNIFIMTIFLFISITFILNIDILLSNSYRYLSYDLFDPYYDMTMALILFIIFTFLIAKTMRKELVFIWLLKVFITLVLMLFYESHYNLDAFVYFSSIFNIQDVPFSLNNSSSIISYFSYYLSYIFGQSYQSLKLVYSLIGFLGLVALYKAFEIIIEEAKIENNTLFIYIFFLFPTILFWSSILGKDPINLFIIGLILYAFIMIEKEFKFKYLVLLLVMLILIYFIRYWFVGIIVLSFVMYYSYSYIFKKNWYYFISFIILASIAISNIDTPYSQIFLDKLNSFSNVFSAGNSKTNTYDYISVSDYFYYFIPNTFTTLFRPMLFDITNAFTLVSACENIVLFILCIRYIFFNIHNLVHNKYIVFLLFYIFSWLVFYVMVAPGNLGTAARFKLQVLPALLIIIGYSIQLKNKKVIE